MKFQPNTVDNVATETVTVAADITDAPTRDVERYAVNQRQRRWQPQHIAITWRRTRGTGGDWSEWDSFRGAVVHGPLICQDGTPSDKVVISDAWVRETDPEFGEWVTASRPSVVQPGVIA